MKHLCNLMLQTCSSGLVYPRSGPLWHLLTHFYSSTCVPREGTGAAIDRLSARLSHEIKPAGSIRMTQSDRISNRLRHRSSSVNKPALIEGEAFWTDTDQYSARSGARCSVDWASPTAPEHREKKKSGCSVMMEGVEAHTPSLGSNRDCSSRFQLDALDWAASTENFSETHGCSVRRRFTPSPHSKELSVLCLHGLFFLLPLSENMQVGLELNWH